MNEIKESIIATNGSKIRNANIKTNIQIEKRKSFWSGFIVGIISSLIASGIWYLIQTYLI